MPCFTLTSLQRFLFLYIASYVDKDSSIEEKFCRSPLYVTRSTKTGLIRTCRISRNTNIECTVLFLWYDMVMDMDMVIYCTNSVVL